MRGGRARAVHLLLLFLGGASAAPAQDAHSMSISTAVAPETVTVGDRFRSVLRVSVPEGAEVEFSPLPVGDSIQPVDSLQLPSGPQPTAVYPLTAWVAAEPLVASVPVRVRLRGGEAATYVVPLRLPVVVSVLPADTTGLQPRPPRSVFAAEAPTRLRWPWLLLALLLLAAGLWFAFRRRREPPPQLAPADARRIALAELDALRDGGLVNPEHQRTLYPAVTRVLRTYLGRVEPLWSGDLTTRELLARVGAGEQALAEPRLRAILEHADRVKFARYQPTPAEVEEFWGAARALIETLPTERAELAPREVAA